MKPTRACIFGLLAVLLLCLAGPALADDTVEIPAGGNHVFNFDPSVPVSWNVVAIEASTGSMEVFFNASEQEGLAEASLFNLQPGESRRGSRDAVSRVRVTVITGKVSATARKK